MRQLSFDEYDKFLAAKVIAAVHYDADWDVGCRPVVRRRMMEAADAYGDRVNFGEVDVDTEIALARGLPVVNVPSVAYYRDGKLVAALTGASQNVKERVGKLLCGEQIGYKDGTDAT